MNYEPPLTSRPPLSGLRFVAERGYEAFCEAEAAFPPAQDRRRAWAHRLTERRCYARAAGAALSADDTAAPFNAWQAFALAIGDAEHRREVWKTLAPRARRGWEAFARAARASIDRTPIGTGRMRGFAFSLPRHAAVAAEIGYEAFADAEVAHLPEQPPHFRAEAHRPGWADEERFSEKEREAFFAAADQVLAHADDDPLLTDHAPCRAWQTHYALTRALPVVLGETVERWKKWEALTNAARRAWRAFASEVGVHAAEANRALAA